MKPLAVGSVEAGAVERPDAAWLEALYTDLLTIRRVEEEIVRLYPTDKIKSPVHLSIGQEAVSVALCAHLAAEDVVFGTYRGHALYIAKGGDLAKMWAELYGKVEGCARGKAGSMHLVDPDVNMMGTSAIVATGLSNAVGYALALKMRREARIVACVFGEGATDEGAFHESVNFAALHRLPILFLCENNGFAIYSNVKARMAGPGLQARMTAYGIASSAVASGDVFEMLEAAGTAVAAVRAGEGPRFLEIATSRWRDHVGPTEDRHHAYRDFSDLDRDIANDQVARLGRMVGGPAQSRIAAAVDARIAAAIAFAEAGAFPADEEIHDHVFAG